MSAQWKWAIGIVSIIVVLALLACGIFFAWRYLFGGKPSVTVVSPPSNYQAAEGEEVLVEARATGRSIVKIELWVDDGLVDSANSPSPQDAFSATLTWQATGLGQHTAEAKAYTLAGKESDPAGIILMVIPAEVAEATPTATAEPPVETPTPSPTPTPTPTSPPGATSTPTTPPPTPTPTPTLAPPVIDYFTIDDDTITEGETTYLRWEFHNATESHIYRDGVEIESGLTSPGDREVHPMVTRTFKLKVLNAAGSAEASVTLTVNPAVVPTPVIHYFKVNGVEGNITISAGDSVTLEWDTDNAWGGVTLNGVGVVSPGSKVETPGSTTTYTLIADNGAGDQVSLSRTVTVEVTVVIDLDAGNSGSVREDGYMNFPYAQPGDASNDQRVKGFLSWDIWSFVPDGTQIVSAHVTWNTHCFHGGAIVNCAGPFASTALGQLYVRAYYYDTLDPSDFAMSGLNGGTLITSYTAQPTGSLDVTAAVLDVNRPWDPFQIYTFFQHSTEHNGFYDGLRFEEGGGKNRLTVTYRP